MTSIDYRLRMPEKSLRGTSSLVVAAFVGPGTVLTCAMAGIRFGYELGWVIVFAIGATFVLQSFSAATGILTGMGLGEAIRYYLVRPLPRFIVFTLVILGLWVGSAAFEMGNLMGAAAGIRTILLPSISIPFSLLVLVLGFVAGVLLLLRLPQVITVLTCFVLLMSLLFVVELFFLPVDGTRALKGLLIPRIPEGSLVTVVALLGTTIVTYNLFLHASATHRFWRQGVNRWEAFRAELRHMAVFLPIGGLISYAIMATGAVLGYTGSIQVKEVADLAVLLEPVGGVLARVFFGLGLFSAGITSAVTAPLAVASGIQELFNWPESSRDWRFRGVWLSVLLAGMGFGLLGWSPLQAIIAAQAANGLLLPLMAGFMVYLTARSVRRHLPGWYFGLGYLVVGICAVLGVRMLLWVWQQIA